MREKILIITSFIVIFSFASVDSSIAPMVKNISIFYGVHISLVLMLISYCTAGIVIGVLVGPVFTGSYSVRFISFLALVGIIFSLIFFLVSKNFNWALFFRFFFGISSGLIASVMWWITFYGLSPVNYHSMIIVLMSARPLAVALGVPFAGYLATFYSWQTPYWFFGILLIISGVLFLKCLPATEEKKRAFTLKNLATEYLAAFKIPYSFLYYAGLTVNRICYFGFYSVVGIWFIKHYNLNLITITTSLLFIGLAEALINFFIPFLLRVFGHKNLFTISIILSAVIFYFFISGKLPLVYTVILIGIFVCLDRIYIMAAVITIPLMFPESKNMTVFGSLNTLTSWIALTAISWFEGVMIDTVGLVLIQNILLASFIIGSLIMFYVQNKTVLGKC